MNSLLDRRRAMMWHKITIPQILFQNSSSAVWMDGNYTWSNNIGRLSTYANKICYIKLPNTLGIINVQRNIVNSNIEMNAYVSYEGVLYYETGISNTGGTFNNTGYSYLIILLYDKPSDSDAKSEDITVTYTSNGIVKSSSSIYTLSNYTCDGTAQTAINTNINLCGGDYTRWLLEADITPTNVNGTNLWSYIRCRDAASPYNGLAARHSNVNKTIEIQINSGKIQMSNASTSPTKYTFGFLKDVGLFAIFNNKVLTNYSSAYNTYPLTIGGELNTSKVWTSNRFGYCTINQLNVEEI